MDDKNNYLTLDKVKECVKGEDDEGSVGSIFLRLQYYIDQMAWVMSSDSMLRTYWCVLYEIVLAPTSTTRSFYTLPQPLPNSSSFYPRDVAAFVDVLKRWFSINGLFERERGFQ